MKFGVRYPDYEVPVDGATVRAFAQGIEDIGYHHLTHFDHIAGMSEQTRPSWTAPYTVRDEYGEALITLTYAAAATSRIGIMTAILVLPMRPTALVAKQAATLDRLSGGRLRLGVGAGWNDIEFELLGTGFEDRYERLEEQIVLLRRFWTQEVVSFRGKWHRARAVGINPLPVQQPIPIWMAPGLRPGPSAPARVGRLADGIIPLWSPGEETARRLAAVRAAVQEHGRDPAALGVEAHIDLGRSGTVAGFEHGTKVLEPKSDEELAAELVAWQALGATHIEFKTRECGFKTVDEHLAAAESFLRLARDTVAADDSQ
jgi:probable F420-dependent oxidoreductase